jgi:hemerythrin-like metal-binding protein
MAFLDWDEKFELGVKHLDEHHRILFGLVNDLFENFDNDSNDALVQNVVDKLVDYSKYHFAAEEKWMNFSEYSELLQHRCEHEGFSVIVSEFQEDLHQGKKYLSMEVLSFLKNWLMDHILKSDLNYVINSGDFKYLIGRQPILNRSREIVAYELLFRSTGSIVANVTDPSQATASVIINTLTGFGLGDILGKHKGFINLELELLMDDAVHILPKEQVVIELLETLEVTPELIERCRFLKGSGFSLALDDHLYSPDYHELYQFVDVVKVDLLGSDLVQIEESVRQLKAFPVQLLAEKVETGEDFQRCLDLGFDLFQGYYFAKPAIMAKQRMNEAGSTLLRLLKLLLDDAELRELESTFKGEPGLTYKLLLLVNTVGVGARNKIGSIGQAIAVLGRDQIKRWVQLALFACGDQNSFENPLLDMAAVRACFMENMAICHPESTFSPDTAFMTGILSSLTEVYDISMDEVVRQLSLSDDVHEALINRQGALGNLLHAAELLDEMKFSHLGEQLELLSISLDDACMCQKRAYSWRKGMHVFH